MARESAKIQTFGASAVSDSATNAATNERMMSGLRPYRSARAPQNGRNGRPAKIENAKRYAEEPERISFRSFEVAFRGENGTHAVSLSGDDWNCECEHFHTSGLCAHVMTLQRVFASHLTDNARFTQEHVPA